MSWWANKLKTNSNILRKALEKQGVLNQELGDHGNIRIQTTNRNVAVTGCDKLQKCWFICISSPSNPEQDSMNKATFATVIQAAWDQYHPITEVKREQEEDETVRNTDQSTTRPPVQSTPRPRQQMTPANATETRAISPAVDSPGVIKNDVNLLEFFSRIISAEYIRKPDLFRPELSTVGLQKQLKEFGLKLAANDHEKTYSSFHEAPVIYSKKDIRTLPPNPCLTNRFKIPMQVPAMAEVAQAIINLSEEVPEILQLPKYGGSKGSGKRIIAIVPSPNKDRLYHNSRKWLLDVIQNAAIDDESSDLDTYDIVYTLVRVLHTLDPMAVEDIASDIYNNNNEESGPSQYKLDPRLQQAMMFKAGLNLSQMRTIKSYCCYSNLDIFQPETEMKKLRVTDYVRPTSIPFKDGGTRSKVAWTVPASDLLLWNTNNALKAQSFDYDNLQEAHVILVGDHGQGAFRMMATLLLITKDGRGRRARNPTVNHYLGTKVALEVDGMVGYVQCQKDTYTVLAETVARPINDDLHYIKNQKELTIYRSPDGTIEMCWGKPTNDCTVLQTAPIQFFMTGNLAFYSMALGKENASPAWCWRCQQSKRDWSPQDSDDLEPKDLGEPWTIDKLKTHLAELDRGDRDKNDPQQKKGVTAMPLFDCIPVANILVPPLHNTELFVNTPINSFLKFVNHRIENLPEAITEAREKQLDYFLEMESAANDLRVFKDNIKFRKAELKTLRPPKRNGLSQFRDDQHRLDFEAVEGLVAQAETRKDIFLKRVNALRAKLREASKNVREIESKKEHGAMLQEVRQQIEQMLQEVYHII